MEFRKSPLDHVPPITVTIVNNDVDFGFRLVSINDRWHSLKLPKIEI